MTKRPRSRSPAYSNRGRQNRIGPCNGVSNIVDDPFDEANFVEKVIDPAKAQQEAANWDLVTSSTSREKKAAPAEKADNDVSSHSVYVYNEAALSVSVGGVTYEFGDKGSNWRMIKLRSLREAARDTNREVEDLAFERYGSLEKYDEAREEEQELSRRKTYGVTKKKPDGSLYRKRMETAQKRTAARSKRDDQAIEAIKRDAKRQNGISVQVGDLNALKARLLKAQVKRSPDERHLQLEYEAALKQYNAAKKADTIVELSTMDTRGEPLAKDENDMTIEELVREEKRVSRTNQSRRDADNIAKDSKFNDSLDYANENAGKLAKRVQQKSLNLKNSQVNDFQRINQILDNCPLCHKSDGEEPPIAPVVSLGTRTFLSLPSAPLHKYHCLIVPTQHRYHSLECDDDELLEIRNFMKSITRMYDSLGYAPIFYENNARPGRKTHCAIESIPIPKDMLNVVPRYFEEAILGADEEWAQHRPLIHTTGNTFTKKLSPEVPYFHVWFDLNGGLGHVIEDESKWPKGDLFGREVMASILGLDIAVWRRKGTWTGDGNSVEERAFKKAWQRWDWTSALISNE